MYSVAGSVVAGSTTIKPPCSKEELLQLVYYKIAISYSFGATITSWFVTVTAISSKQASMA